MVGTQLRDALCISALCICVGWLCTTPSLAAEKPAKPSEADAYAIRPLKIPPDAFVEVGALEWIPDGRLAVASRRGEVWMVSDPAGAEPRWQRFAHGLHEVLGLAWRDG